MSHDTILGKFWSLSQEKQSGSLDETRDFLGQPNSNISCCSLKVPISMDVKSAIHTIPGLIASAPEAIRSFEIWWDGKKKQLKYVLSAQNKLDLSNYKISFQNVYPNVSFVTQQETIPEWFSAQQSSYDIFDVSLHHGHYSTVFDTASNQQHHLITNLSNSLQLYNNAWIQFVFAPYNFISYLRNHQRRLDSRIKYVTSKNYRTWIDDITNQKSYENPENGLDFYNNYKDLLKDSRKKTQDTQIAMSIRGMIKSDSDESKPRLSFENIKSRHDHLTQYSYNYKSFYHEKYKKVGAPITINNHTKKNFPRLSMFDLRLIPNPKNFIGHSIKDYFEKTLITAEYRTRKPMPYLILNPNELSLFVHLPNPTTTKNIQTTLNVSLPSKLVNKNGFNIGYFEESQKVSYGMQCNLVDEQSAIVSPIDFSRHIYCVGGTGSGKTSLIRIIAKHLEEANQNETFPNSFIYLDPKGEDSEKFIQQCNENSIKSDRIHYLEPLDTGFSINPLELPKYSAGKRDEPVSRYVGYFLEMVKEWYGQQQTFVQMERIFRVLLFYMYYKNDAPTFIDMYDIIIQLQDEGEKYLQIMFKALGMPGDEIKQALSSIASLKADSFVPLLNRVEQFATDPILKKVFCQRHGTVSFEELIQPGHYTIVRISTLNLAHHIQPLAVQAFVIKLWFTILERASHIKEDERNQVVLALDEFQIVKDLQILPLILSQARSYRLGLLLAHQTMAQIDDKLLEEIVGNSGTQLAGRISGKDASRLGNIWDPKFSKELTQQMASQEDFHWTCKMRASPGQEQPTPIQFWLPTPPEMPNSDEQLQNFIASQKARYSTNDEQSVSILSEAKTASIKWMRYITVPLPEQIQWQIMLELYKNGTKPLQLGQITERLKADQRDDISDVLHEMVQQKMLDVIDDENRNAKYILSQDTITNYFTFDSTKIGTADDIPYLTQKAVNSYLKKGYFLTIADQSVKKDEDRTDLIAYSYDTDKAISVEIESAAEIASHPEAARKNMVKWPKMGFAAYHGWATTDRLKEIRESQIEKEKRKDVLVFIV
ncbi:MAG: TraM recognition domain-containing protein [Nitrosopumilus sp.]|nr:TraM recognition domain-containing protein [Nitrosopumilus sp.]